MSAMSTKPVPPPSPQEVHRKLSVHAKPKKLGTSPGAMSGTESDSDSQMASSDVGSPHTHGSGGASLYASSSQQPLQAIAERRSASGDETDEDEDEDGDAWRVADKGKQEEDEKSIVMTGYLWKKGSRRKTWKKRWFVLRSPHLAYYKTSAEYQLLRLLDLNEVHSVTPVSLKKHSNTFGLVLPTRTYYLQAASQDQVSAWVRALNEVRERLQSTASITPVPTPPIAIPTRSARDRGTAGTELVTPVTPSPPNNAVTSSDEDDGSPNTYLSSSPGAAKGLSPAKGLGAPIANDPTKVILSGYLMKCGKRKSWRKRWFVLTGEKLVYSGNHMDNKHQRQIPLSQILDAMEYMIPSNRHGPPVAQTPPALPSPPIHTALDELADPHHGQSDNHTFKVVTTKRSILLCAPSEEEEIRWLSAVRALIARRSGTVGGSGTGKSPVTEGGTSGHGQTPSGGSTGTTILKSTSRRRSISAGGLVAAVEEVVGGGGDKA